MYRRAAHGWTKHLDFICLDLVCLHLAFLAAFTIRNGFSNPYENEIYMMLLIGMTLVNFVMAVVLNTYKSVLKRGLYMELMATLRQDMLVVVSAVLLLFALKESTSVSRIVIFLMGGIYAGISFLSRLVWKAALRKILVNKVTCSLLLVANREKAELVIRQLRSRPMETYRLKGIVLLESGEDEIAEVCGVPVVADAVGAAEYVCREWVDEILYSAARLEDYSGVLLKQFMEMGITVHLCMPDAFNPYDQKQYTERLCGMNVLTSSIRWVNGYSLTVKRALDIGVALIGCIVTVLLLLVIGPIIYFSSPGPIFFKQVRVGRNGKKFKMYKFRSMYLDAEERKKELLAQNNVKDGMMFKLDYDPRIIGCKKLPDGTVKKGIGNFIRDWSLDEFPQFFNVLLGDMSAVGTRPPTVDEWEKYELHHRQRLAIKPGVTGLWQVSGRSNIVDFEEVVKLDAQYIANWSVGKDVKIILKTLKAVAMRDGAK